MAHLLCNVSECAVIFNPEGKAMVVKGAWDGRWMLPGGRLDESEQPIQGLRRELQEEIGLTNVKILQPFHTGLWGNNDTVTKKDGTIVSILPRYCVSYLATIDEVNPSIEPTDEQECVEWITVDQIEDGRTYIHQFFSDTLKKAFEVYNKR